MRRSGRGQSERIKIGAFHQKRRPIPAGRFPGRDRDSFDNTIGPTIGVPPSGVHEIGGPLRNLAAWTPLVKPCPFKTPFIQRAQVSCLQSSHKKRVVILSEVCRAFCDKRSRRICGCSSTNFGFTTLVFGAAACRSGAETRALTDKAAPYFCSPPGWLAVPPPFVPPCSIFASSTLIRLPWSEPPPAMMSGTSLMWFDASACAICTAA